MPSQWLTSLPIAHRGLHGPGAPENSLAAFERAVDSSYPIELDVRLLADGNIAVFHDKDALRLTGIAEPIESCTADSLKRLRLFDGPHAVPLLPEVLDLVDGRVGLLIEIKNETASAGPLETAVLQALKGYNGAYALQSFNHNTMRFFAENAPQSTRGQLVSASIDPAILSSLMSKGSVSHADFIACELSALPNPMTDALRAMSMPVIAWTIKTLEDEAQAQLVADNYIFENLLPLSTGIID